MTGKIIRTLAAGSVFGMVAMSNGAVAGEQFNMQACTSDGQTAHAVFDVKGAGPDNQVLRDSITAIFREEVKAIDAKAYTAGGSPEFVAKFRARMAGLQQTGIRIAGYPSTPEITAGCDLK